MVHGSLLQVAGNQHGDASSAVSDVRRSVAAADNVYWDHPSMVRQEMCFLYERDVNAVVFQQLAQLCCLTLNCSPRVP